MLLNASGISPESLDLNQENLNTAHVPVLGDKEAPQNFSNGDVVTRSSAGAGPHSSLRESEQKELEELVALKEAGDDIDEDRLYELDLLDRFSHDESLTSLELEDLDFIVESRKRQDAYMQEFETLDAMQKQGLPIDNDRFYCLGLLERHRLGLSLTDEEIADIEDFEADEEAFTTDQETDAQHNSDSGAVNSTSAQSQSNDPVTQARLRAMALLNSSNASSEHSSESEDNGCDLDELHGTASPTQMQATTTESEAPLLEYTESDDSAECHLAETGVDLESISSSHFASAEGPSTHPESGPKLSSQPTAVSSSDDGPNSTEEERNVLSPDTTAKGSKWNMKSLFGLGRNGAAKSLEAHDNSLKESGASKAISTVLADDQICSDPNDDASASLEPESPAEVASPVSPKSTSSTMELSQEPRAPYIAMQQDLTQSAFEGQDESSGHDRSDVSEGTHSAACASTDPDDVKLEDLDQSSGLEVAGQVEEHSGLTFSNQHETKATPLAEDDGSIEQPNAQGDDQLEANAGQEESKGPDHGERLAESPSSTELMEKHGMLVTANTTEGSLAEKTPVATEPDQSTEPVLQDRNSSSSSLDGVPDQVMEPDLHQHTLSSPMEMEECDPFDQEDDQAMQPDLQEDTSYSNQETLVHTTESMSASEQEMEVSSHDSKTSMTASDQHDMEHGSNSVPATINQAHQSTEEDAVDLSEQELDPPLAIDLQYGSELLERDNLGEELSEEELFELDMFLKQKEGIALSEDELDELAMLNKRRLEEALDREELETMRLRASEGEAIDEDRYYELELYEVFRSGAELTDDELFELECFDRLRSGEELSEEELQDLETLREGRLIARLESEELDRLHEEKIGGSPVDEQRLFELEIKDKARRGEELADEEVYALELFNKLELGEVLTDVERDDLNILSGQPNETDGQNDEVELEPDNAVQDDEMESGSLSDSDKGDEELSASASTGLSLSQPSLEALREKRDNGLDHDVDLLYELELFESRDKGEALNEDELFELQMFEKRLNGTPLDAQEVDSMNLLRQRRIDERLDEEELLALREQRERGEEIDVDLLHELELFEKMRAGEVLTEDEEFEIEMFQLIRDGQALSEDQIQELEFLKTERFEAALDEEDLQVLRQLKRRGEWVDEELMYELELFQRKRNGDVLSEDETIELSFFQRQRRRHRRDCCDFGHTVSLASSICTRGVG